MSLRTILHYPDNRLRQVCPEHTEYDESLKLLVSDMFETMYHEKGIGLSAIQINVITRVITIDVSNERNEQLVLINPIITEKKDPIFFDEGCLSVPGFYEKVERYNDITLEANDVNGKKFSLDASELLAVCIQHEIDHLDGKLFVDYLSDMKRSKIEKGLLKQNNKSALHRKENPYLK
ncbi:MAG: peptide deformylase [Pseudomonadota bacterium]|nr:peptide deformylase [Pseudomonadota bacterium]